jgi:hypothetical protein
MGVRFDGGEHCGVLERAEAWLFNHDKLCGGSKVVSLLTLVLL